MASQQLQDIEPGHIGEVLATVPGVAGAGSGSFFGQGFNIRGFGSAEQAASEAGIVQLLDSEKKFYESYRQGALFVEPDFLRQVEVLRGPEDVRELDHHPLYHALPRNLGAFDFLFASGSRVRLGDLPRPQAAPPEAVLARLVEAANAAGARVAYLDITAPDIAPLGPRVVRCFATGLQPIHFGHGEGRLGGRRLYEAPLRWGLRAAPLAEADLNPCPHPLA